MWISWVLSLTCWMVSQPYLTGPRRIWGILFFPGIHPGWDAVQTPQKNKSDFDRLTIIGIFYRAQVLNTCVIERKSSFCPYSGGKTVVGGSSFSVTVTVTCLVQNVYPDFSWDPRALSVSISFSMLQSLQDCDEYFRKKFCWHVSQVHMNIDELCVKSCCCLDLWKCVFCRNLHRPPICCLSLWAEFRNFWQHLKITTAESKCFIFSNYTGCGIDI